MGKCGKFFQRMMTELKYTSRPRRWDITRNHRDKVFSSPRWGCPPLNFSHSLKIPLISINFICDWKHWPYPAPPPPIPSKVIQWSCTLFACFSWLQLHISMSSLSTTAMTTFFCCFHVRRKTHTLKVFPLFLPFVWWCGALPLLFQHLPICCILPDVLFRLFV